MTAVQQFLQSTLINAPWAERIGWTLVHSLWQVALIALGYALVSLMFRKQEAKVRYACGCVALLAMIGFTVGTFLMLPVDSASLGTDLNSTSAGAALPIDTGANLPQSDAPSAPIEVVSEFPVDDRAAQTVLEPSPADEPALLAVFSSEALRPWMPLVTLVWLLGVVVLSFRPIGGWLHVRRLQGRGLSSLSDSLQQIAKRSARSLGVTRMVRFAQSTLVAVPTVVGFLRPLVLLPVSTVSGLAVREIELILIHELAHIRRQDYLVNLAQTVIESLLFFHPAMWWLSAQIRMERENCCDDIAVAVSGNRAGYVEALTRLEEQRLASSVMALAATGGSLLGRVQRLLGQPHAEFGYRSVTACLTGLLVIGLFSLTLAMGTTPEAPPVESDREAMLAFARALEVGDKVAEQLTVTIEKFGATPIVPGKDLWRLSLEEGRGEILPQAGDFYLSFYLEADRDDPHARELPLAEKDETITVEPFPFLTDESVLNAEVVRGDQTRGSEIAVSLSEDALKILGAVTLDSIRKRVAIVIDGKVLSVSRIDAVFPGARALIAGDFSPQKAEAIAEKLNAYPENAREFLDSLEKKTNARKQKSHTEKASLSAKEPDSLGLDKAAIISLSPESKSSEKKQSGLAGFASKLIAGGANQGVTCKRLDNGYLHIVPTANKPRCAIVTNGSLHGAGVQSGTSDLGLSFNCKIKLSQKGRTVGIHAKGDRLVVGDETYSLSEGRLFAVAIDKDQFFVKQFAVSEDDGSGSLLPTDDRLETFFNSPRADQFKTGKAATIDLLSEKKSGSKKQSILARFGSKLLAMSSNQGVTGKRLDNRYTHIAPKAKKPHCAIVTDGSLHSAGVQGGGLVRPSFHCKIELATKGRTVDILAKRNRLVVGDETYNLSEGRLFAVAIRNDQFLVEQFVVPEEDGSGSLLPTDDRLEMFFKGAWADQLETANTATLSLSRERKPSMKKQSSLLVLASMLLAGCADSPGVVCTRLDNRSTYIASLGEKPQFAIVTDGKVWGGVKGAIFLGSKFDGTVKSTLNGTAVDFHTKGNTLVIGDKTYSPSEGRLFAVALNSDPLVIKQFVVPESDNIRSLIKTDGRVDTFFNSL